jgi:hypothetical protein
MCGEAISMKALFHKYPFSFMPHPYSLPRCVLVELVLILNILMAHKPRLQFRHDGRLTHLDVVRVVAVDVLPFDAETQSRSLQRYTNNQIRLSKTRNG